MPAVLPSSLATREQRYYNLRPGEFTAILSILYRNIKKGNNQDNLVLSQNNTPPPRYP
jgi:hypothetical protein